MGVNMYKKNLTLTVQKGNPLPQVINWYGKLDVRKLNRQDYREIPRRLLLEMRTGMDAVYLFGAIRCGKGRKYVLLLPCIGRG